LHGNPPTCWESERVIDHSLEIKADSKLVKQCLRRFKDEKQRTIEEGVGKLLVAGFISEGLYLDWLANPVLAFRHGNIR
jgi:hypothetical protein